MVEETRVPGENHQPAIIESGVKHHNPSKDFQIIYLMIYCKF
jgi:hypothetical protein